MRNDVPGSPRQTLHSPVRRCCRCPSTVAHGDPRTRGCGGLRTPTRGLVGCPPGAIYRSGFCGRLGFIPWRCPPTDSRRPCPWLGRWLEAARCLRADRPWRARVRGNRPPRAAAAHARRSRGAAPHRPGEPRAAGERPAARALPPRGDHRSAHRAGQPAPDDRAARPGTRRRGGVSAGAARDVRPRRLQALQRPLRPSCR